MKAIRNSIHFCFILFIFFTPIIASAQGTLADYQRADSLRSMVRGLLFHSIEDGDWVRNTHQFWYRIFTPRGKEFMLVDADQKTKKPAFDHEKLATELSKQVEKEYKTFDLPFNRIEFKDNRTKLEFVIDDYEWSCDLATYKCEKGKKVEPRRRGRRPTGQRQNQEENTLVVSPDEKWETFIKNYNVYVRSAKNKEKEFQLSFNGIEGHFYGKPILWSPDSKKIIANRIKPGYQRVVHYVESSPEDQLQPKYSTRNYSKPGDVITIRKPNLFHVETKKQVEVDDALFKNPYNIRNIKWRLDSRVFTFNFNQRGHQVYRIIEVNANSGDVRALVDEECETFFCYSSKFYRYDVDDGKEIIWMSERDGWNHLYLYDGLTGKVKNQITKGKWVVRGIVDVDSKNRTIVFQASGREKGQDPYLIHYYKINFDGSGLIQLTKGNGNHDARFSDNEQYFVDTYSRVDSPPISVLRRGSDGAKIMDLEKADVSDLLKTGWKMPEVFNSKARDGKTNIWGIILRPTNFDPSKKYRVIEYIYAGPHDSHVPKTFRSYHSRQAVAELGFIVVQIDGMGTSNRSKTFHDFCWKNLKDAGFPDRILWHKAAAKKYSFYDISEGVGIYGHSAGGQNSTGALLFHPDFYTVAVSSCGCHDNRMDKIWWNEQWMGYPIGPEYAASSNADNAFKLRGKLFLIVGELDTNVPPASTLQVVDALVNAKKDFDLLVLPGVGHSIGGDYGERRRRDYFVKHLLGVEPPNWNMIELTKMVN